MKRHMCCPKKTPSVTAFRDVVELCSGIGVMSFGLESAGAHIKVRNDLRSPLVEFQKQDGTQHVIEGDIGDNGTLKKIFDIHSASSILTCGFSCQPWSRLGDNRRFDDQRAQTLVDTLRAAFFFRSAGVILECVSGSGKDPDVQRTIKNWCQATGFWYTDCILHLEHFWVARRERWWCILSSPCVPKFELKPLPKQNQPPVIADFMPIFPTWPPEELAQLQIDEYEYGCFDRYGGIHSVLVDINKPLSTALHGWGNQLTACPCSCRKGPMSLQRLSSKGLFGALIPCDGSMCVQNEEVQCLRHIHPWECAILNGAQTDRQWMPSLKLSLCGLGQMASPFHSAWVFGQWIHQVGKAWEWEDNPLPETFLWNLVGIAVRSRDSRLPHLHYSAHDIRLCEFIDSTHRLLFQSRADSLSPLSHPQLSVASSEVPSQQSEVDKILETHVIDDGYLDIEEWDCPFPSCFICRPFVGDTGLETPATIVPIETGLSHSDREISPTIPFDIDNESNSLLPSIPDNGGVPAFRRKQDFQDAFSERPQQNAMVCNFENHLTGSAKHDLTDEVVVETPSIPIPENEVAVNEHPQDRKVECNTTSSKARDVIQVGNEAFDLDTKKFDQPQEVDFHHIFVHFPDVVNPLILKVSKSVTIGQFVAAEVALQHVGAGEPKSLRVTDSVGQLLPWSQLTYPMQHIFVHRSVDYISHGCGNYFSPPRWFQSEDQCQRISMLYRQESWVAHDEMTFYLNLIASNHDCVAHPPLVYASLPEQFSSWVSECLSQPSDWIVTSVLLEQHWAPVVFHKQQNDVQLFTTREGYHVFMCERQLPVNAGVQLITLPSLFSADCGFQTVGWIIRVLTEPEIRQSSSTLGSPVPPLKVSEAIAFRTLFEQHLFQDERAGKLVIPCQIALGGAIRESIENSLHDLLRSHGVPEDVVHSRISTTLEKLGRVPVSKAIRSSKPWHELKQLANNVSPRLQLVLPSELSQVIRDRAAQGKPFGDKQRKQNGSSKTNEPGQLNPEDISIPEGIFKMGQDQVVRQLALGALCKDSQGVVVVTAAQAQPYLRLQHPMSQAGLALLILDHSDASCLGSGCLVRFPAKFEKTGEPLIATARIVQLGCVEISRHLPAQQLKVEEVPTQVVRVLCYREEFPGEWSDFIAHPVKFIMENTEAFLAKVGGEGNIIDVWDRQFVNLRMERRQPKFADTFIVSIRATGVQLESLLVKSGHCGLYYEPRSSDGRSPDDSYRVVWLPRVAKPDAMTSQQTSEHWSCLARSGPKFGLRIRAADAKNVHDQHKPFVPYLDGLSLSTFIVGPFGYGVTKQGLSKLFSQWKWAARPCQPRGKSADGLGVLWEVQAQERPEFDVYTLEHGDVLISLVEKKKVQPKPKSDILASSRTLDVLKARTSPGDSATNPQEDVLQKDDPWANFTPSAKAPRVTPSSVDSRSLAVNVDMLQANVDKKVAATLAQFEQKLRDNHDDPMESSGSSRLSELEHRMCAMESSLQNQQLQHQHHQNQVAAQFTQLQQQVDAQGHSLQKHLDDKMQEQLSQIERLLGRGDKKSRQE